MKKFLEIIKNKWLIKGTTTLLLVLIVIACYIGLNILVEKVNVENLDFTEKKLYSLSEETKTKLKDLDQDVTIQLINAGDYSYVIDYAKKYPQYGFEKHKGYVTKAHKEALRKYGPCPIHRKSFKPVQEVMKEQISLNLDI